MSNNQDWYDDDEFDFDDEVEATPQRGDDVLKKVRRADRAKEKKIRELESELESLRKFQRESTISKVLQEKGVNPKIAAFIPSDMDTSAEAVSSWLEQYGDIFGVAKQETPSVNADMDDLAALRQIDAATSGAYSPDDINDSFSVINNASSAEELLEFLYSQGAE